MPRYEFRCVNCHAKHERILPPPPHDTQFCPDCGDRALRVYTNPMVPVLDDYDKRFRRRRRPNPGDDIARAHDPIAPPGHDSKPRRVR